MKKGEGVVREAAEPRENRTALLVSKDWEIPAQQEQVQELKRSFGRVMAKLKAYGRLLINYRNKSEVVLLRLEDWNRVVERQEALEARIEELEDLLEDIEMAPEILRRAKASEENPSELLTVEQLMEEVRKLRP